MDGVDSSSSPAASAAGKGGRIPFVNVVHGEGDEWPQPVSMTREAQDFIAQIEEPICVLVCMGQQNADKVDTFHACSLLCFRVFLVCAAPRHPACACRVRAGALTTLAALWVSPVCPDLPGAVRRRGRFARRVAHVDSLARLPAVPLAASCRLRA